MPCVLPAAILRRAAASPCWDSEQFTMTPFFTAFQKNSPALHHHDFHKHRYNCAPVCSYIFQSSAGGISAQKGFAHSSGLIFTGGLEPARTRATRAMQAEHNECQSLSNTAKLQTSNQTNGEKEEEEQKRRGMPQSYNY